MSWQAYRHWIGPLRQPYRTMQRLTMRPPQRTLTRVRGTFHNEVGSKHEEMIGREVGDGIGPGLSYDVMTTGPSAPAPPTSGCWTPISELSSPAIVSMYGGPLMSYTIWDHCLEELNADKDGGSPATSVEDLLCVFRPLLAESVLCQIRHTLDALQDSTLGVEAALIHSKETILRNVLSALKERAYPPVDSSDEDVEDSEGWQAVPGSPRMPVTRSVGIGRPVRGTHGRGSGGGRGSQGRQSDNDGDDDNIQSQLRSNGQYFQTVKRVLVDLDEYTTPSKGNEELVRVRKLRIAERAQRFSQHPEVGASHVMYIPYDVDGSACFYHGTRLSTVQGFSRYGVLPFNSEMEFSLLPAFYVTNSVVAAFEFPFHNHLANDPGDTVAVFRFELDLQVLHGDVPPPSNGGRRFKVRWFERGVNDAAWRKFCIHNMYGRGPMPPHEYDIVIGAMCFPNGRSRTVSPRSEENLLQVAFCSKAAWKWVGSCVTRMYVESRVAL